MSNTSRRTSDEQVWKRRGLFAAAAALAVSVVAKMTEQTAQAGTDGDVVLGVINTGVSPTNITNTGTGAALVANSGSTVFPAHSLSTGIYTSNTNNSNTLISTYGLFGHALGTGGIGIMGVAEAGGTGVAGLGLGTNNVGVLGQGSGGIPVLGEASGDVNTVAAVYGFNNSSYAGPSPGAGGFGVYGLSAKGHGLVGATATAGGVSVVGATNGIAGAYAGAFYGPVVVDGDFTVVGGAKSAAVPHPDGSHRRLYCVESPESWFEDFGKGQLENGCATVMIDPDFAAVVDLTDYHVFLTGYDGERELTVTNRTALGFCVESSKSDSRGTFSWRMVAKRKDIVAPRFEAVTIPPEPTLPSIPEVPAAMSPAIRVHG